MNALKLVLIVVALSIPLSFCGASQACSACGVDNEREQSANNLRIAAAVGGIAIAGSFFVVRIRRGKRIEGEETIEDSDQ